MTTVVVVAIVTFLLGYGIGSGVGMARGLREAKPFQERAFGVLTEEVRRLNRERDIAIAEREALVAARARQAAP